ncbi:Predicted arabinose efflux permease, MFS family [Bradyrhizobium brasilense]|uniref:Predicted arabinose efflux permease, MFS family n=2 Tax=Bradyrhizobium brasilense TaxID=1419277 RepID=A0A1G6PTN2_9BRAD|nr:Predicted arabinose efflux permease, MFS family [Bradyrhizobium brasilense]
MKSTNGDPICAQPLAPFASSRMSLMSEQTIAAPINDEPQERGFSRYQSFLIALLAFTQFTLILDFIIMSPLGAILMPSLNITAGQFGVAVSAYAFAAGISGVLAAGFADRFDRKRLLLFFYVGFMLGTVLCALAQNFHVLLLGRIVTGVFGGVIGSVVLAIVTDLFPLQQRGRAMGILQTAFAASQVLGVPAGLFLANHWNWHICFVAIVGLSIAAIAAIAIAMQPVDAHLKLQHDSNPFRHLIATVGQPSYTLAFLVTTLLATGGFMLMPFGSAFTVHNLGIDIVHLPTIYLVSGLFSIIIGPLVGRASDAFGKYPTFVFGCVVSVIMVLIYTNLGHVSLLAAIVVNVLMFIGIFSRMIPSQALMSAIPDASQRGSFSAISASVQQLSGGLGSVFAAAIIAENPDGSLLHFDRLGYIVVATTIISMIAMYFVQRPIARRAGRRIV